MVQKPETVLLIIVAIVAVVGVGTLFMQAGSSDLSGQAMYIKQADVMDKGITSDVVIRGNGAALKTAGSQDNVMKSEFEVANLRTSEIAENLENIEEWESCCVNNGCQWETTEVSDGVRYECDCPPGAAEEEQRARDCVAAFPQE
jgi:hypothetical protein